MSAATQVESTILLAEDIVAIRRTPDRREELVALLAEQATVYRGLSTGETERIRGFILAGFATTGLPQGALPFVREELETGINPYTVAAAAMALRGAPGVSDETLAQLVAAAERIASNDDNVQFETIDPGDRMAQRTSALAEIVRTIAMSGPRPRSLWNALDVMAARGNVCPEAMVAIDQARRALSGRPTESCCCAADPPSLILPAGMPAFLSIDELALEDQRGATFSYGEFFRGRPSIVTFFYTRCMNPQKCSLTVSKLAALQRQLAATDLGSRINVAAISYDPAYDQARRLQIYGMERGFRFDERNQFIRTVDSFAPIQAKFNLGVGFGAATVNRHSLDLLVLDAEGEAVRDFRRIQWSEAEVVRAVKEVVASPMTPTE